MAHNTQSLPGLYSIYKSHTKYVLGWLWSVCPLETPEHPSTYFKSTQDIIEAAKRAQKQSHAVPGSVLSALSSAIKTRWKVLETYQNLTGTKDKLASDLKHKAFVERLEHVFHILKPQEEKLTSSKSKTRSAPRTASFESTSNRFGALDIIDRFHEAEKIVAETPKSMLSDLKTEESEQSSQSSPADVCLQDDDIGELIELSLYLYELDSICEQVNSYWKEAAQQHIPIPLAAWLSNLALHAVSRISVMIEHIAPTNQSLVSKWLAHKSKGLKLRFKDIPDLKCQAGGRLADGGALHHIGLILEHCRTEEEYKKILPDVATHRDPFSIIHRPVAMSDENRNDVFQSDDLALDQMQESIRQSLVSKRAIAGLELSAEDKHISEPLLSMMSQILTNTDAPIPTHLVFGMEMLLSTYKAFLWPDGEPNKQNCRIMALKFASEVQKSISATISAIDNIQDDSEVMVEIASFLLQKPAAALSGYLQERRFDLYYQAPWTAGCHMVAILDMAFAEGLRLCWELGYVSAVLHLYNALQQLDKPISRIILLDQLCQIFLDPLFLGTLPKGNFGSHFRRATGQRIKKRHDSDMTNSKLSEATVASTRRVAPSKMSLFSELHGSYYHTTADFWCRIYIDPTIQRPNQNQIKDTINQVHSVSFNVPLEKIKNRVLLEFNGDKPIMRIDFFAIFRFCVQMLQDFGDDLAQDPQIATAGTGVRLGFAFVDHVLNMIDEHLKDDFKRRLMPYWRQLNLSKAVFTKVDCDKSISDFLWTM